MIDKTVNVRLAPCALVLLVSSGCGGGSNATERAVEDWVSKQQQRLPADAGSIMWTGLRTYESQVIATFFMASGEGAQSEEAVSDDELFDSVTAAVCEMSDIDVVWESDYEFFTLVESDSGDALPGVQTKAFDCCVLDAMASMSREAAQNQCHYDG